MKNKINENNPMTAHSKTDDSAYYSNKQSIKNPMTLIILPNLHSKKLKIIYKKGHRSYLCASTILLIKLVVE